MYLDPPSKMTGEVTAVTAEAAIAFRGVAKTFASKSGMTSVIDNLNLEIREGEFFSLLGPSGCGKTTALRMIAGFEQPTRGDLLLGGRPVNGTPPHQRDVNIVFQSYALFPHMDVYDNIEYGLRRKRIEGSERRRRVEEALDLMQLKPFASRRPSALSGGQQQRVALARALVNRPRVLLLDEPLAALDAKLRATMQTELRRIQQDVGITFVFVTHDQQEAFAMSDRIAILNAGRLEQVGTPTSLYRHPESRFVADFVGQSNFFSGPVSLRDGRPFIDVGEGQTVWLPHAPGQDNCTVLVRPEHITVSVRSSGLPAGDCCRLKGIVIERQFLGSHESVKVRTALLDPVVIEAALADASLGHGTEVWISWLPHHSTIIPDQPGTRTNL